MNGDNDVTLAEQLISAVEVDACFCVCCGQPDEPGLHDPARCAACGGVNDPVSVAFALRIFDQSCANEPDLSDEARALHCAIVAAVLAHTPAAVETVFHAERIAEVMEEGDGFWCACSGCQESDEGYVSEKYYPYVAAFKCQPGSGCGECGGLGVIWDDTDYEAMARFCLAEPRMMVAGDIMLVATGEGDAG